MMHLPRGTKLESGAGTSPARIVVAEDEAVGMSGRANRREADEGRDMTLFKSDHARRIDRVIDYFGGYPRARWFRIVPARRGPRLLTVLAAVPARGRIAA